MSDDNKPLFREIDAQEAADADAGSTGEGVVVPGAAAGPLGGNALSGQMGATGIVGMPLAGPEIAGAAHAPGEDQDGDSVIEDDETGQKR